MAASHERPRRGEQRSRWRNVALAVVGTLAGLTLVAGLVALVAGLTGPPRAAPAPVSSSRPMVTAVPPGFPLTADYPETNQDLSPVTVVDDVPTTAFRLCPGVGFEAAAARVSRLPRLTATAAASYTAPKSAGARLLTVWADEPSAAAALQSARDALAACVDDDVVTTERETGYDVAAAVFTRQPTPGTDPGTPDLEVYEVVQVRNAVYLSYAAGSGASDRSAEAALAGVQRAAADSAVVLSAVTAVFGAAADRTAPAD
ncbi:hypothetical protein [Nocardioides sp.]|uniref:hypothetical protein n=1 Tax=Nocardioides sp. TaxID=35761 RepID=UPI002B26A735|nr:hypothetical protein [Nocardioides sp.]